MCPTLTTITFFFTRSLFTLIFHSCLEGATPKMQCEYIVTVPIFQSQTGTPILCHQKSSCRYQKPAFVVAFWAFDNYYIPRDPITLSKDDWGLQWLPQQGILVLVLFSEGDWILRVWYSLATSKWAEFNFWIGCLIEFLQDMLLSYKVGPGSSSKWSYEPYK